MWVLIYIFSYSVSPAATTDKAEWRLVPSVVFQEFSSEERCKEAKSKIEATLKQAGDQLRNGLEDLRKVGTADPSQIVIAYSVECLPCPMETRSALERHVVAAGTLRYNASAGCRGNMTDVHANSFFRRLCSNAACDVAGPSTAGATMDVLC